MKFLKSKTALTIILSLFLVSCAGGNGSMNSKRSNGNNEESNLSSNQIIDEEKNQDDKEGSDHISKEKNPYIRDINEAKIWTKDYDNSAFNIKGVEQVKTIGLITGDGSINETRTKYRVGGTDLGIPVMHKDKLYLWFGDTFWGDRKGKPMEGGLWRSNVLAISSDFNFTDGIEFDDMVGNDNYAKELLGSQKIPGVENTVIPTGSVSINGKLYVYFMSVKEWGKPGRWTINYGGLAVSTDDGENFTKLPEFKLNPDKFGQVAAIIKDDYVYGVGIGGGRYGNAYLTRVKTSDIENQSAYEYFIGVENGEAKFASEVNDAKAIVEDKVGEPSIMWNEYLQEYIITYLNEPTHAIVMRSAKELWGEYSDPLVIGHADDFPALYGGFVHEVMTRENGKVFYYIMSQWDPIYNSILMEVTLK